MLLARCKLNSFFPVFLKQLLECSWSHIPPANICLWPKFVVFSWLSYLGPIEGFSLYQIRAWYYIFLSNPNAFKSLLQFVYLITDILVIKVQFNSTEKSHLTAARSEIKSVITTNRYGCFILSCFVIGPFLLYSEKYAAAVSLRVECEKEQTARHQTEDRFALQ